LPNNFVSLKGPNIHIYTWLKFYIATWYYCACIYVRVFGSRSNIILKSGNIQIIYTEMKSMTQCQPSAMCIISSAIIIGYSEELHL